MAGSENLESGLSGRLWPVHLKPLPDELLSSWLVRLAAAHGLKLHTFCALTWGRDKHIWNRDPDRSASTEILTILAEKTATPIDRVQATMLSAYTGVLYEQHLINGSTPFILKAGVWHRKRKRLALQYCALCLREDYDPYYRRSWRLACVVVCVNHGVILHNHCPACTAPIAFHRGELGEREKLPNNPLTCCYNCQFDLRATSEIEIADPEELTFQTYLMESLEFRWAAIPGQGTVQALLFFQVLRQLMKLLASGGKKAVIRESLIEYYQVPTEWREITEKGEELELLGVTDRRKLLRFSSLLLRDWPDGFIRFAQKYNLLSSLWWQDLDPIPYWYWQVIHDHLYLPSYQVNEQEVIAATRYLGRQLGRPPLVTEIARLLPLDYRGWNQRFCYADILKQAGMKPVSRIVVLQQKRQMPLAEITRLNDLLGRKVFVASTKQSTVVCYHCGSKETYISGRTKDGRKRYGCRTCKRSSRERSHLLPVRAI